MGRLLLIANPKAGKTRIRTQLLDIVDIFVKYGWEVEVHITQDQLDAMEQAEKRGGSVDLLVCSGGMRGAADGAQRAPRQDVQFLRQSGGKTLRMA